MDSIEVLQTQIRTGQLRDWSAIPAHLLPLVLTKEVIRALAQKRRFSPYANPVKVDAMLFLFKHCSVPTRELLQELQKENREDWIIVLLHLRAEQNSCKQTAPQSTLDLHAPEEAAESSFLAATNELSLQENLSLNSEYIRHVLRKKPKDFLHCIPYITAKDAKFVLDWCIKNRLSVVYDYYLSNVDMSYAHADTGEPILLQLDYYKLHTREVCLWSALVQNPLFSMKSILLALCSYHTQNIARLSTTKKHLYWDASKLAAFDYTFTCFHSGEACLDKEILAVFPHLFLDVPFGVYTRKGKRFYFAKKSMSALCALASLLAHDGTLCADLVQDYEEQLMWQFKQNNPYLKKALPFLYARCWDACYRYLYCFTDLPLELRVLIAGGMW